MSTELDPRVDERAALLLRDLVADRGRVLCVQRTGWGKSAVYFISTALLREQGAGPALIVSPLLALMRNQIAAAERLGIRAHTINSTNRDAWEEVRELPAQADRLAWLATWLPQLDGSGIVYTLTKRDADLVAGWLTAHGIAAEAYSGEGDTERRVAGEEGPLRHNPKGG